MSSKRAISNQQSAISNQQSAISKYNPPAKRHSSSIFDGSSRSIGGLVD